MYYCNEEKYSKVQVITVMRKIHKNTGNYFKQEKIHKSTGNYGNKDKYAKVQVITVPRRN